MIRTTTPRLFSLALFSIGLSVGGSLPVSAQGPGYRGPQRGPHSDRPRFEQMERVRGQMGRNGVGAGAESFRLEMRIRRTLDQAGALELDETQRQELEALLGEVETANDELRSLREEHRTAREAAMQRIQDGWQPLPDDEAARLEALEQREAQRRSLQASFEQMREVTQARIRETTDPLVQRYESIVPPSQRPQEAAAALEGRGAEHSGPPGMRGGMGRRGAAGRAGPGGRRGGRGPGAQR